MENRNSGWNFVAFGEPEVQNMFRDISKVSTANELNIADKNIKKLKKSVYPTPTNILHPGRQIPRTPGPGVLPLLPSQIFQNRDPENGCFSDMLERDRRDARTADNVIPTGRQLPRTPLNITQQQKVQNISNHEQGARDGKQMAEGDGTILWKAALNNNEGSISTGCATLRDLIEEKGERQGLQEDNACKNDDLDSGKIHNREEQMQVTLEPALLPAQLKNKDREDSFSPGSCEQGKQEVLEVHEIMMPLDGEQWETQEALGNKERSTEAFCVPAGEDQGLETIGADQVVEEPVPVYTANQSEAQKVFEEVGVTASQNQHGEAGDNHEAEQLQQDKHNVADHPGEEDDAVSANTENQVPKEAVAAEEEGCLNPELATVTDVGPCLLPECIRSSSGAVHAEEEVHQRDRKRISQVPIKAFRTVELTSMTKNMKDYLCNPEDLEFLERLQDQNLAVQLKTELLNLQKKLKTADQEKDLLAANVEKVKHNIIEMKTAFDQTVQLGRLFLSRKLDPASVELLPPEAILKQLNVGLVLEDEQRQRTQLLAVEKERENFATSKSQLHQKEICKKREHYNQQIKKAEQEVQQQKEQLMELNIEIKETQEKLIETQEQLKNTRAEIDALCALKEKRTLAQLSSTRDDPEKERVNRRLKRLLQRKEKFLERERILQRLSHLN
ncbi:plectin-like [Latimeria chalumnae]|uniref:plectin-like n=1 Tax=Latimeria chalumnae TaxID=7897 RepID=UPI0006D9344D|nr:PREDICTED: plectin-like [Latimeria chalumnae]|eukprot:XP_014351872.1 PREDICTED: plectin-like [Latimeria chalumnae]